MTVEDSETLCRRIPEIPSMWAPNKESGGRRPSSGAYKPDSDGLSVYLLSVLAAHGLPVSAVRARDDDAVCGNEVTDLHPMKLSLRLDSYPADVPDPAAPRHVAHALVLGWPEGEKARRRLQRRLAELAHVLWPGAGPPTA